VAHDRDEQGHGQDRHDVQRPGREGRRLQDRRPEQRGQQAGGEPQCRQGQGLTQDEAGDPQGETHCQRGERRENRQRKHERRQRLRDDIVHGLDREDRLAWIDAPDDGPDGVDERLRAIVGADNERHPQVRHLCPVCAIGV